MRRARGVALAAAMVAGNPIWAASFHCDLAKTPQEKVICADAKLGALDTQTAAAYKTLLTQLSAGAASAVRGDQEAWLRWRDATCPAQNASALPMAECLREAYTEQLTTLRSGRRAGGMMFYPRLELEIAPEARNMADGYGDPGFGTGRFAWLVIDQPNAAEAAWNQAVRVRVIAHSNMQMEQHVPPPTAFRAEDVKGGTFFMNTAVDAANSRYIAAELDQYRYFYGGAHGGSTRDPFNWWLDKGRALRVEDIFGSGNEWRQPFARLCWQTLQHGPEAQDLFINGDTMAQSFTSRADVDKLSLAFADWIVDGSGITVLYGEYAIAPYAAGIVQAHLSWADLKPYLVKAFDPAALPLPLRGAATPQP